MARADGATSERLYLLISGLGNLQEDTGSIKLLWWKPTFSLSEHLNLWGERLKLCSRRCRCSGAWEVHLTAASALLTFGRRVKLRTNSWPLSLKWILSLWLSFANNNSMPFTCRSENGTSSARSRGWHYTQSTNRGQLILTLTETKFTWHWTVYKDVWCLRVGIYRMMLWSRTWLRALVLDTAVTLNAW